MPIRENIEKIQKEIGGKATLVAAVKYATSDQIKAALDAGITHIGFNTYQQMEEIAPRIKEDTKTHFIGTLQKNKAKKVVGLNPLLIQSVDSYKLTEKINNAAEHMNKIQDILIQVKTDPQKSTGVAPKDLNELLLKIGTLKHIKIRGLMTITPFDGNPDESRPYYHAMHSYLKDSEKILKRRLDYLSMGMSGDYMEAIEEGANMVRIGSAIFR
ncbi:MAG: YggS family pyridoxal phosphate-dependent enzyme [archaeon]